MEYKPSLVAARRLYHSTLRCFWWLGSPELVTPFGARVTTLQSEPRPRRSRGVVSVRHPQKQQRVAPAPFSSAQHTSYSISTARDDDDVTEHTPRDPRRRRRRRRSRSRGLSQQRAMSTRTFSEQPALLPSDNAATNYPQEPNGRIVALTNASPKSLT